MTAGKVWEWREICLRQHHSTRSLTQGAARQRRCHFTSCKVVSVASFPRGCALKRPPTQFPRSLEIHRSYSGSPVLWQWDLLSVSVSVSVACVSFCFFPFRPKIWDSPLPASLMSVCSSVFSHLFCYIFVLCLDMFCLEMRVTSVLFYYVK
jgi:hypothetical protein